MLSILIPIYNYDVTKLVQEVYTQTMLLNIKFEILCYDDGSTNKKIITSNKKINNLEYATYFILKKNIGRSAIRNLLAKNAKFEWLLFLDADVFPKEKTFVTKYLQKISKDTQVIYGGILYEENKPNKDQLLRWQYGKYREALSFEKRNKNVYLSFLTLNFLINKNVFEVILFDEKIPNLRHEDTLFSYHLKLKNINLEHINNPIFHLGIEESNVFLKKSLESIDTLKLFLKKGLIPKKYTLITKVYFELKKVKLHYLFAFLYRNYKSTFERNLLSKKPSIFLFDLYRLSYLCFLYKK